MSVSRACLNTSNTDLKISQIYVIALHACPFSVKFVSEKKLCQMVHSIIRFLQLSDALTT